MANPSLEDVTTSVLARLPQLEEGHLLEIADLCALPNDKKVKAKGKGRSAVLRLVLSFLTGEEIEAQADGGLELLVKVQGKLKTWEKKNKEKEEGKEIKSPAMTPVPPLSSIPMDAARKEFKIKGQIGDPGQREKLPFTSLVHQIDRALSRGYPEADVVDAVINAMVPGLSLRAYLETKPDLDLPVLRRLLRSHYREKEATELYHDLTRAVQEPKESPQEFLLRMLALRQKILFASKEANAAFSYDATLVQGMFLHSLLTGITNENIKSDLKPLLQKVETTDEALVEQINIAANNEEERQQKLATTRKARVSELNSVPTKKEDKQKNEDPQDPPKHQPHQDNKWNFHQMREDIRSMIRAELAAVSQPQPLMTSMGPPQGPPDRGPEWGCQNCRTAGRGPSCRHCFRCGGNDHFLRDCRHNQSENARGAPDRGNGYPTSRPARQYPQQQ